MTINLLRTILPVWRMKIPQCLTVALFCFICLVSWEQVVAQTPAPASKIKPLSIGDKIPDELWNLPLQVVNHPQGKQTITLADYKDKLIILDFWATWCSPCIGSLYKLDTVQKEYSQNLAVLPVTTEAAEEILPFIKKQGWKLQSFTNDKVLKKYFPYKAVPFQVWIKSNKLFATTNESQVTRQNIADVIEKGSFKILTIRKDDVNYNSRNPLLFDGNGGNLKDLKYSSIITGYLEGIFGGGGVDTDSLGRKRLRIINANIERLYSTAAVRYNPSLFYPSRMIVADDIKQLIPGSTPYYQPELKPYFYSYEILVPALNDTVVSNYVIEDLNRFFVYTKGIKGYVTKKDVPCWIFTLDKQRQKSNNPFVSSLSETQYFDDRIKFVNQPPAVIFSEIQNLFFAIETPFINEIKTDKISIEIPYKKENLNFQEVRDALIRQGISVEKEIRKIDMIILEKIKNKQ